MTNECKKHNIIFISVFLDILPISVSTYFTSKIWQFAEEKKRNTH